MSELVDYLGRRGLLQSEDVHALRDKGFLDELPLSVKRAGSLLAQREAEPPEPEEAPPRRRSRTRRGPDPGAWIERTRGDWLPRLQGWAELLEVRPEELPEAAAALSETRLRELLVRSFSTDPEALNRFGPGLALEDYRDCPRPGPGYRMVLEARPTKDFGPHSGILRELPALWVYRLILAQRRFLGALGELFRERPLLVGAQLNRRSEIGVYWAMVLLYNTLRGQPEERLAFAPPHAHPGWRLAVAMAPRECVKLLERRLEGQPLWVPRQWSRPRDLQQRQAEAPPLQRLLAGGRPTLSELMDRVHDLEEPDEKGDRPLHVACREGWPEIAGALLEMGAEVNAVDARGHTPLHLIWSHPEALATSLYRILQRTGADLTAPNHAGRPALFAALEAGPWALALMLGDLGEACPRDHQGRTALHRAVELDAKWAVPLLAKWDSLTDENGWTWLHLVFLLGHTGALHALSNDQKHQALVRSDRLGRTPLHLAGARRQVGALDSFAKMGRLREGPAPHRDREGKTPLHYAAEHGMEPAGVRRLWRLGFRASDQDQRGRTPVLLASSQAIMHLLVEEARDNESPATMADDRGQTPLHRAVELAEHEGIHEDLWRLLLARGASLEARDGRGRTVLLACRCPLACGLLLDMGADPQVHDEAGLTPLHVAAEEGDSGLVKRLLEAPHPPHADARGLTALHLVGCSLCVAHLLSAGWDPNALDQEGRTPLETLSEAPAALCLLDHGARPLNLHHWAGLASPEVVRRLLEAGADLEARDSRGRTALLCARGEALTALLEAGARLDVADPSGQTAVHRAVRAGWLADLKLLLEAGARVNGVDAQGLTPLYLAALHPVPAMLEALLAAGARPDVPGLVGLRPLHLAALRGDSAAVEALLKAGAAPNAANRWGQTPLHLAVASSGSHLTPAAQALLVGGAGHGCRDGAGLKPLDMLSLRLPAPRARLGPAPRGNPSPLHQHAARGELAGLVTELALGQSPNLGAGPHGLTPLHEAAAHGQLACVRVLLALGADPRLTDARGLTAARLAEHNGYGASSTA